MSRLAALLVLLVAAPVAAATTAEIAPAQPVTLTQARELVAASEIGRAFRGYRPVGDGEVRLLILVDRHDRRADLALAADGSLWMVARGRATPATSRDLADAHIDQARLVDQLQARKIRPIALRIPRTWLVAQR